MPKPDYKHIKQTLEYNMLRPYFGELTYAALNDGYHCMYVTRDWDCPLVRHPIKIGTINGEIICQALWQQMSYNPVRFGTVSPFIHNGRNNIYHFCNQKITSDLSPNAADILAEIQHNLIGFLTLNAAPSGQWRDSINTNQGWVTIRMINGHSGPMYKMLVCLRKCIRAITKQNVADFRDRRGPYRAGIIDAVGRLNPAPEQTPVTEQNVVPEQTTAPVPVPDNTPTPAQNVTITPVNKYIDADEYARTIAEERMDDAMDSLQITIANQQYIEKQIYEQAVAEYQRFLVAAHPSDHQK